MSALTEAYIGGDLSELDQTQNATLGSDDSNAARTRGHETFTSALARARLYLQGPFAEGTPEQGYQLRMTPAELVQAGIADVNEHAIKTYQQRFEALAPDGRVTVLAALEQRHLELPNVPAEVLGAIPPRQLGRDGNGHSAGDHSATGGAA